MNRRDFMTAASAGAASATMATTTLAQTTRDGPQEQPAPKAKDGSGLRTITLEEHYASPGFIAGPGELHRIVAALAPAGAMTC